MNVKSPFSPSGADRLLSVAVLTYVVTVLILTVGCLWQPWLNEYREAAQVEAVSRLLNGLPLYSEGDDAGIYLYGPAYPVLVAWVFKCLHALFGLSPQAYHIACLARTLSWVLTLAVAVCGAWSVRMATFRSDPSHPVAPSLLAFALLLAVGYPLGQANPAPLGTLLIVAAFLFGKRGWMVAAALLTVTAFYVKAYFLAIALPLCLLAGLKSRRRLSVYLVALLVFGGCSWLSTLHVFPLFARYNVVHHAHMAGADAGHLLRQSAWLVGMYLPLYVLALRRMRVARFRSWLSMPYLVAACSLGAVWVPLALHPGSFLSYAYQLWLPFLTVGGLGTLSLWTKPWMRTGWLALLVFTALVTGGLRFTLPDLPDASARSEWHRMGAVVTLPTYRGERVASYSPLTYPLSADNRHLLQFNNGQTEYIPTLHADNAFYRTLCPAPPALERRCVAHRAEHLEALRAAAYAYVVTDEWSYIAPADLRRSGYEAVDSFAVSSGLHTVRTYLFARARP